MSHVETFVSSRKEKITLSYSIVRSFCLNCPLCKNVRGQRFCFVVYDPRAFLLTALRLSEASGLVQFFPLSPDCPHLSSSSESLNFLFFQPQKSVSLLDETHWTSDSCT